MERGDRARNGRVRGVEDVAEFWRALRDDRVLSLYLAAEEHDPAQRRAWRVRMKQMLDGVQAELPEDGEERSEFGRARERLEAELEQVTGFLPGPGWAGFATADRVWRAGSVPAPTRDQAVWRRGPALGPYLRALKQARPVVVALVDERRARIFVYQGGRSEEVIDYRAEGVLGDLSDINISKRAATHSGVRGETATDVAQRSQQVSMERMLHELAETIQPLVGEDGYLLIGGADEAVASAQRQWSDPLGERVVVDPSLSLELPAAKVRDAAARNASALSARRQERLVAELLDAAGAGGTAVAGEVATGRLLERGQVKHLVLSARFWAERPGRAEELIGGAFAHGGTVEEVGGEAGERLDREGGGVGALLRYRVRPAPA